MKDESENRDSQSLTERLWQKMPWLRDRHIARIFRRLEVAWSGKLPRTPVAVLPKPAKTDLYDSTGLTQRAVPYERTLDSFSAAYPATGSGIIGSDREYALRRTVKNVLDSFRDQGWSGDTRSLALVENYRRNGFRKLSCVLCSEPIFANLLLLEQLNRLYEQGPEMLPEWGHAKILDGEFWNPSDVAGREVNFDHMSPRARRNHGLAPAETHDHDPDHNTRWCELKEEVPTGLGDPLAGRRSQAEMLHYARRYSRQFPKATMRELKTALRENFGPLLRELYNHPQVVGVTHPSCNSRDGSEYGRKIRHQATRPEILRRWQLREHWQRELGVSKKEGFNHRFQAR